MAQRSVSTFKSTKNSRYADNTTGLVTAGNSRDMFEDTADSFLNITDHFIDEDSFASDSATKVPSQQSVKAYVDAQVGSGVQTASITLSSAEILALNSSPKQIIAAPGAGKAIMIHNVFAFYTFISSAYGSTNDDLYLIWAGITGTAITAQLAFFSDTTTRYRHMLPNNIGVTSDISNKAVQAYVPSADPTGGDSTAKIIVTYTIVDIP